MRNRQINKEVRWALYLTLFYILGWMCAYLLPVERGVLGLPIWFEFACLLMPCLLIGLIFFVVKYIFKEISLESE